MIPNVAPPVDVEAVLVAHFTADGNVGALVKGVSTELPEDLETRLPWLQITLIDGAFADPGTHWLGNVLVQLDAWASRDVDAVNVAAVALVSLVAAQYVPHDGAVVTDVRAGVPVPHPDPDTDLARYRIDANVWVHPTR